MNTDNTHGPSVLIRVGSLFIALTLVLVARGAERPNILFLFADDQRHDTASVAGHPIVQMPTIDRLATEGVRFRNAFVTTSVATDSAHATALDRMRALCDAEMNARGGALLPLAERGAKKPARKKGAAKKAK